MDDFRAQLRALPETLAEQASTVVKTTATQVGQEVEANYPERTGNLKRGVRVTIEGSHLGVRATVRSASPHAHLFERGTKVRETRSGANRGSMPQGPENELVIPRAIRARQRMTEQLIAIVREAGMTVSE